jgi:hypothetical protein
MVKPKNKPKGNIFAGLIARKGINVAGSTTKTVRDGQKRRTKLDDHAWT